MKVLDPMTRYREYLGSFGIVDVGDRVVEVHDLDLGNVRFFAYSSSDGLRLKAAVTPSGLSRVPNADAAAERIAWLETNSSTPPYGLPSVPTVVLSPDRPPTIGVDPAQWAFVTVPMLLKTSSDSVTLTAWFLPSGTRVPERWTVTTRAGSSTTIAYASAFALLVASASSVEAAASDAAARARRLLASGTESERWWALQQIGETGDRAAVPDMAALLANADADPNARLLAAGTLARLADPATVVPLGAALHADPSPEVRRECAHAIGRIGGASAVRALADAASHEPDVIVRAEIVHALAAQGFPARAALARIASGDPETSVRNLAHHSLDAINLQ